MPTFWQQEPYWMAWDVPAGRKVTAPRACRDCGLDDPPPDETGSCRYCAELAALRAWSLPGSPLNGWWYMIPAGLAAVLAVVILYAILYAALEARTGAA